MKLTIYHQVPVASTSNIQFYGNFDSNSEVPGNYSDELSNELGNADFVYSEPPIPPAPPRPPPPPPPPPLTQSGRPQRNYRVPRRYVDLLPEAVPIQHEGE